MKVTKNIYTGIPKKLIPIMTRSPEYFLPDHKIIFNEVLPNSLIHVRCSDNKRIDKILKILKQYSPNIEVEGDEIVCCFTSFFRMKKTDLSDIAVLCAIDLFPIKNINFGIHLGSMTARLNPNGYDYPIFDGFELQIGLIMGDLAKKINKKCIVTEGIYSLTRKKSLLKCLGPIKLVDGREEKIYSLEQ